MPLQECRSQKLTELSNLPLGIEPTPADSDSREPPDWMMDMKAKRDYYLAQHVPNARCTAQDYLNVLRRTDDLQCIAQSLCRHVENLAHVRGSLSVAKATSRGTAQHVSGTAASPTTSKSDSGELEEGEIREPSRRKTYSEVSCHSVQQLKGEQKRACLPVTRSGIRIPAV